jgi:hypothetical protein
VVAGVDFGDPEFAQAVRDGVARVDELIAADPSMSVVGIAGPGDALANAAATLETMRLGCADQKRRFRGSACGARAAAAVAALQALKARRRGATCGGTTRVATRP